MRKIATHWDQHQLTLVQKWHRYGLVGIHLERYRNEGDAFLKRIVTIDMWARASWPAIKRQSIDVTEVRYVHRNFYRNLGRCSSVMDINNQHLANGLQQLPDIW
ncbi:hypothetical protein TNCV_1856381 [Trichonephila clavipes]|nr:hypothetical protein TNCV_1856381 [Trichonephila clavipes]